MWSNVNAFLLFIGIAVIYTLYGLIIVHYWRLKKRSQNMKKQQRRAKSIEESKQIGGTLQKEARNMLTFLKDSKYVIFVISAFTVSWMPGIVLVFWDLGLIIREVSKKLRNYNVVPLEQAILQSRSKILESLVLWTW